MSRVGAMLLVVTMLAAATAPQTRMAMAADVDKPAERIISVSGTGSVTVDPDIAHVSTGVVVEADTAKEALTRNSAVMAKLIDGLKSLGIAAKDIQTSSVNVEPRYVQAKDGRPAAISGYRVVNQVRMTVRDVKRVGEIVDAAIGLGANQLGGISFDVANPEALIDDARKQAIANARRRAEIYAGAAGAQLGEVLRISEDAGDASAPMSMARRSLAAGVPVEPGTRTLSVDVHVTYALR